MPVPVLLEGGQVLYPAALVVPGHRLSRAQDGSPGFHVVNHTGTWVERLSHSDAFVYFMKGIIQFTIPLEGYSSVNEDSPTPLSTLNTSVDCSS